MTKDKNSKNKQTNGIWLALFVIAISLFPAGALADSGVSGEASKIIGGIVFAWLLCAGVSFGKPKDGLMLTAIMAAIVSLYLGNQHFSDGPALCDAGDLFSCSTVNTSEYSELFGVPIAFLGAGYYVAMLFLAFLSDAKEYESVPKLLIFGGVLSVIYSVVLAYLSSAVVGAWCLFCISLYGFNAIALFGAFGLSKKQQKSDNDSIFSGKAFGNGTMIFVATVVVCVAVFSGQKKSKSNGTISLSDITEGIENSLSFDGSEPRIGASSAQIQMVEFADFECPHCAMVAPELKKLVEEHPSLSLRFKQYPLSNICNPNVARLAHENACAAASATECAHKQGKFWDMSRLVFKNQNYLSGKDIEFLAEQVGLDMAAFSTCMDDPSILAGISSDIKAAEKAGVSGTPSIFVTGIDDSGKWYRLTGSVADLAAALSTKEEP
jgi:protein-disulfide isomerase